MTLSVHQGSPDCGQSIFKNFRHSKKKSKSQKNSPGPDLRIEIHLNDKSSLSVFKSNALLKMTSRKVELTLRKLTPKISNVGIIEKE